MIFKNLQATDSCRKIMGYRGLETENYIRLRGSDSRCMAHLWHGKMAPSDSTLDGPLMGLEITKPHLLIIDRGGHMTIMTPALPCPAHSSILALAQVKDVEFAKAPDFDACLAAVRSLSGKNCTCWARSVVDVVVVRACSVLTRCLNQLRDELYMFILFIYMSRCSNFIEIPSV